ncbi:MULTISPECIES: ABC transporter permease subunit [unclassified Rhodococcus (in: high G+C Gram-positive bacteria)]|jgi:ABC-2 type transport system permease protein|uniref:ABC transporter permease subunit n=1 Tax=unclassified Rhodococcus (in: high G+C Gram-positive bacteria) TaxID=192944 RepID=UPI0002E1074E|nr:ABC transporter permease subunit [Rhodococcus sp. DK17]
MLRSVLTKTLYDQRRAFPAWVVGIALLVAMYVVIWPSVRDQPAMNQFLDQMPEAFRALFAMSGADMSTPVGYIQIELLSFMGPLLLLIYAVGTGAAAVAGEEDRGTLDQLLATPLSRGRILAEKFGALTAGTVALSAVMGLALLGEGILADMDLPVGNVAAAMVHLALLALVFGALAFAIGAATGHPASSRSVPAVIAILAYVLNGLGPVVSWLAPWQRYSPFYQYAGHDPLRHGFSLAAASVSALTIAVLLGVALVGFAHRDVVR